VAEPAACPHLVFAAQIAAGRDGVARDLAAPAPVEDPYRSEAARLPADLGAAIDAFEASELWPGVWGADTVRWLATIKRAEWRRYLAAVSEWEQREYYGLF
jgi:glutamine synthetase